MTLIPCVLGEGAGGGCQLRGYCNSPSRSKREVRKHRTRAPAAGSERRSKSRFRHRAWWGGGEWRGRSHSPSFTVCPSLCPAHGQMSLAHTRWHSGYEHRLRSPTLGSDPLSTTYLLCDIGTGLLSLSVPQFTHL